MKPSRFHPGDPNENNTMTADQITEYRTIDIRMCLAFTIDTLDEIIRDIRNGDTTPESAAARVNAEIAKINAIAK